MLIKMNVVGLTIDPFTNAPIIILKDKEEKNTLPIWIGIMEASAIASELEKMEFSRPMTHDLLHNILKKMEVKVERVELTDLVESVYYAKIFMSDGSETFTVDARPSDAIALALRAKTQIFVDSLVLEKSKEIELPKGLDSKGVSNADFTSKLDDFSPEDFGKYKM
ncbi:MAG: bifunctional nuclease family protein [Deltaproteobacteria bacterium]|nr:bifunctional nuclease family protein [Deltaproteobacteria bacterium]